MQPGCVCSFLNETNLILHKKEPNNNIISHSVHNALRIEQYLAHAALLTVFVGVMLCPGALSKRSNMKCLCTGGKHESTRYQVCFHALYDKNKYSAIRQEWRECWGNA